ncbi:hypothetical protein ACFIJ5_06580 [Haloimpatiens sp. FM7330]|uniref:hypothetical protein n=1 Tax=Haloimpatiens sp. FM7330 TaxID=3298610 RepID=UPI003645476F
MWKFFKRRKTGLIMTCIGIGILLAVIVPIWGWVAAVGLGFIYCGWYISKHCHH